LWTLRSKRPLLACKTLRSLWTLRPGLAFFDRGLSFGPSLPFLTAEAYHRLAVFIADLERDHAGRWMIRQTEKEATITQGLRFIRVIKQHGGLTTRA